MASLFTVWWWGLELDNQCLERMAMGWNRTYRLEVRPILVSNQTPLAIQPYLLFPTTLGFSIPDPKEVAAHWQLNRLGHHPNFISLAKLYRSSGQKYNRTEYFGETLSDWWTTSCEFDHQIRCMWSQQFLLPGGNNWVRGEWEGKLPSKSPVIQLPVDLNKNRSTSLRFLCFRWNHYIHH